jgi:large subunit ribosomal protein LX
MGEYTIRGRFMARDGWAEFEKRADAPNEAIAVDRVYAKLGSDHGLKRTQIDISEVER